MKNQNTAKSSWPSSPRLKETDIEAVGVELSIWYLITINLEARPSANWEKNLLLLPCVMLSSFQWFSSFLDLTLLSERVNGLHNAWMSIANACIYAPTSELSNFKLTLPPKYTHIETELKVCWHTILYVKNVHWMHNMNWIYPLFVHLFYMCMYKISLFFSSFSSCLIYQTISRCFIKKEGNGIHIQIWFGAHGCITDVWAEPGDSVVSVIFRFAFELHGYLRVWREKITLLTCFGDHLERRLTNFY